jgi:sensor histidine kinase regulating citrate/malate metabolism
MPEIRVRTRFDDQTKEVVITVTDNGRGVDVGEHEDHAVRHRLQQELVFGGGHSTQAGEDHGEGGRFCREAIERHNGSIKITSEGKFKGAEVEIRLPIGEPPQEAN